MALARMKKILVINNHDSFTYNLVDLIRQLQVRFDVVSVEDLSLDCVEGYTHILISPGPDVPSMYPQLFAMLERFYQTKSILGVCLGHQTLCEFFGGEIYNLPSVRHGQKRRLKVRSNSGLFLGLPAEFIIDVNMEINHVRNFSWVNHRLIYGIATGDNFTVSFNFSFQ